MNLSPVRTRTRRSTGVERPVGTVPRYIPGSGSAPIAMFSTLPSAICATSKTPESFTGWPAEFGRRTSYESPHPRDTGACVSSARYGPPDCLGIAFGVAASVDGALVGCGDVTEGFGVGRIVALNRERSLLALSSVPALAGPPGSSDGA